MLIQMTPPSNLSGQDVFSETANRSTDGMEGMLLTPEGYAATALVLFCIGFFGFFLNLIVIFLMINDKELRTPMNVILFNLVCSDFSVSIFGNPFTLASSLCHYWIFGQTMCVMYGFFMSLLGISSITTLTILSFERYVMISRPFHRHQLTNRGAKMAVLFSWAYAFALTGPPIFGWGEYVSEAANISCSVNWEHSNPTTTSYIVFLFVFGLAIPVAIIVFSYINIVFTLRQNTFRMSRVSKAEAKVAVMVGVMIIAFLVAWTPYATVALIIAFGDRSLITPGIAVIPALMAKSSICYNPIIYAGLNPQFQASWRHKVKPRRPKEERELTMQTPTTKFNQSQASFTYTKKTTKVSADGKTSLVPVGKNQTVFHEDELDCDNVSEVLQVTYHLHGNPQVTFQ